jgi:hypothetical protein
MKEAAFSRESAAIAVARESPAGKAQVVVMTLDVRNNNLSSAEVHALVREYVVGICGSSLLRNSNDTLTPWRSRD